MEQLKSLIIDVPNFPSPGINFKDISQILATDAFGLAIREMAARSDLSQIDFVAGVESRGFIIGAALAQEVKKGFLPIRKKGKLPPPLISKRYTLEYGTDEIQIKSGTGSILLVDDVLATGGTLNAAADLCVQAGYTIKEISVLIDLQFLNQFNWRGISAKSLVQYRC